MQKTAKYIGLSASLSSFILGIAFICSRGAKLTWPSGSFIDDVNAESWRGKLFSLEINLFCDSFAPLFMGVIGIAIHLKNVSCSLIAESFLRYFIFLFFNGLLASMGYMGGLGILVSIICYLGALLSLIVYFIDDGNVSLQTKVPFMK